MHIKYEARTIISASVTNLIDIGIIFVSLYLKYYNDFWDQIKFMFVSVFDLKKLDIDINILLKYPLRVHL